MLSSVSKKKMKSMSLGNEDIDDYFTNMRRCTKCILPETFPGIEFNETGVCNYCLNYEPVKVYGEKELEKVLASAPRKTMISSLVKIQPEEGLAHHLRTEPCTQSGNRL